MDMLAVLSTQPLISGFTPINRPKVPGTKAEKINFASRYKPESAKNDQQKEGGRLKEDKWHGRGSSPLEPAAVKRLRKAATHSRNSDISKNLQRTKPGYEVNQLSLTCRSSFPQAFEAPPSAQPPSSIVVKESLNPAKLHRDTLSADVCSHENHSDFGGFLNEFDEFPAGEDNFEWPDAVTIYDEELQRNPIDSIKNAGYVQLQSSSVLNNLSCNIQKPIQPRQNSTYGSENEFDELDLVKSLEDFDSPTKVHQNSTPCTSPQPPTSPKLQWLAPKAFHSSKSPKARAVAQDLPYVVPQSAAGTHLPFARPPFPKPVRDRSPILGLTNNTVLRTCFRIGEALNAATHASRSKTDAVIELYARVIYSSREADGGFRQFFQFADLFTEKPPYLSGISTIWKGVELWEQDSRAFLSEVGRGKMCRVVGRIRKGEGQSNACGMTVLSIWQVDWEEIGIAKGVVCF